VETEYHDPVDAAAESALRALDELRAQGVPTGPVTLTPEYLRSLERLEAHPDNEPGTDKTWVSRTIAELRAHYASVRRVR